MWLKSRNVGCRRMCWRRLLLGGEGVIGGVGDGAAVSKASF